MKASNMRGSAAKWLACGALVVSAIPAAGCSSSTPPPQQPVAMGEMDKPGPQQPQGRNDADTTIQISEDFRRQCSLPNAQNAPHFDYAESTLRAHGQNILDDVAKCLSDGPLKGKVMTIIGRTDARGSAEYNKELSANRAEAARNYLTQHGVAKANILILARGEKGAQGTDEQTWALDRRVDFELGDRTASGSGAPDPVMEGTRMQALSPGNTSKANGSSYSDTAEGGHEAGSSKGSSSASGSVSAGSK